MGGGGNLQQQLQEIVNIHKQEDAVALASKTIMGNVPKDEAEAVALSNFLIELRSQNKDAVRGEVPGKVASLLAAMLAVKWPQSLVATIISALSSPSELVTISEEQMLILLKNLLETLRNTKRLEAIAALSPCVVHWCMTLVQSRVESNDVHTDFDRHRDVLHQHYGVLSEVGGNAQALPQESPIRSRYIEITLAILELSCGSPTWDSFIPFTGNCATFVKSCWGVDEQLTMRTLEQLFDRVSEAKGSAIAFYSVLECFPTAVAQGAATTLAQLNNHDESAKKVINHLFNWPTTEGVATWMCAVIHGLSKAQQIAFLFQLSRSRVHILWRCIRIPHLRLGALRACERLLLGSRHNVTLFHGICPSLRQLLTDARGELPDGGESDIYDTLPEFHRRLVLLVHCLVELHPGYPEIYSDFLDLLFELPTPQAALIRSNTQAMSWSMDAGTNHISPMQLGNADAPSSSAPKSSTGFVGLANLGNTCYLNSFVQALFITPGFRNFVISSSVSTAGSSAVAIGRELGSLFKKLVTVDQQYVVPRDFLRSLPSEFQGGNQQDSFEFGKVLLDALEHCYKGTNEVEHFHQFFRGTMRTRIKCANCGGSSDRDEIFDDILLSLPTDVAKQRTRPSVQTLVDEYFTPESLSGENKYHCNTCGGLQDARMSSMIHESGNFLIVVLNRFAFDISVGRREKIGTPVDASEYIILGSRTEEKQGIPVRYKLYAAVIHSGKSAHHGHYYCIGNGSADGITNQRDWVLFNDGMVTTTTCNKLKNITDTFQNDVPYILLYEKCPEA